MNRLIKAIEQLMQIKGNDWEKLYRASSYYIEILSISSADEIEAMLDYFYKNFATETTPFWARLIAFKILVLQKPNNNKIKQWAINDALMFGGPEWKKEVEKW